MNQQYIIIITFVAIVFVWWYIKNRRTGMVLTPTGSSVLNRYTRDLTALARSGKMDTVVGRENEIERVIHILSRRTKNNPLLLGEPGVGKTAIAEGIALRIVKADAPEHLVGKRMLALDLGAMISGTKYRGDFEGRVLQLVAELQRLHRSIILFVDEVQTLEQIKGAEGAVNMSDIIKPALARGEFQLIGATTWTEYEKTIKPDDALNRRLQPVIVGEPSEEETLRILRGIKSDYEQFHRVNFSDEALQAAIRLSKKYIKDRFLPDKAIDLIDEAGAKVAIEATSTPRHAMGVLHAAGASATSRNVTVEDIRSVVAEWTGRPLNEII